MEEAEKVVELEVDELFVGLTRPATVFGVHFTAFVVEMIVVGCVFLAIGNPIWLLLFIPTHGFLYLLSASDPGRFDSLTKYGLINGRCLNRMFWKATSFSPLAYTALPKSKKSRNFASAKK
ncbi:VirB3 family type IV secretion system protein [Acidovorax sp. LjRoot74]|uniref:type IV secretion system protein VirB3 n=1 Tax=Acidovorax sp. LjRoot74 TaxID=3342337 RepID=UPI003ECC5EE5